MHRHTRSRANNGPAATASPAQPAGARASTPAAALFVVLATSLWAVPALAQDSGAGGAGTELSLAIGQALEMAGENSTELTIERLKVAKATAAVREARARRGPSITFQSSGSVMTNPMEGFKIEKGAFGYAPTPQSATPVAIPDQDYVLMEDAEYTYFRLTATLSQPLFTFGKLNGAIRAADFDRLIAEEEFESKEMQIRQEVRKAYFGALFAAHTKRILDQAVKTAAEIVEDRERAFDEGVITRQQVLEVIARRSSLSSQLVRAGEGERSARSALSMFTGMGTENYELSSGYRTGLPELDEDLLVGEALANSGARAVLLHRVGQATTLLEIERASRPFLPDFSLNVSFDLTGQKIPFIGSRWTESWDTNIIVSVGTQAKLFDSGASRARIEQAEGTVEMAREGLLALEEGLELQVRGLVEGIRTGWYETQGAGANLDLAREIERNAQVSFDNELITRAELLAARINTFAAELELELAGYTFETSLSELEHLSGVSF